MERSINAMQVALRVLRRIGIEHRDPDPADLEELRKLAPTKSNAPLDELACEVIQQALKRQADIRRTRLAS